MRRVTRALGLMRMRCVIIELLRAQSFLPFILCFFYYIFLFSVLCLYFVMLMSKSFELNKYFPFDVMNLRLFIINEFVC